MGWDKYKTLIFCVFWWLAVLAGVYSVEIREQTPNEKEELQVTISRGAHVTAMEGVTLFTEMEFLTFLIPDIPDPPRTSPKTCTIPDEEACTLYNGLQCGVNDISQLLSVVNRVLTTKGLDGVSPQSFEFPEEWINTISGVTISSSLPPPEVISAAGEEWFDDTEARLTLRTLLTHGTENLSDRQRRWVKHIIKPALRLAKMAGLPDVSDIFQMLFVGDNSILSYLTGYKAFSRKEYQVFAELPRRVSELQSETKKLFQEVLNSTEIVKNFTLELQEEIKDHAFKLATVEEAFLLQQNTISDVIRSLYTAVVYSMHFSAYDECRASKLPIAFVPPKLLHQRLQDVEGRLPENIRFAIPVNEYQRYYRLPLSECVFDSNGGIIRLSIPLVEKSANLQLYEFKTLHFAHEAMTCALQTPSSFIVKDLKNNKIFTVSDIDEDECQPKTSGLCKVPFASADDSNNFCHSVLLSGEPTSVVKESCPLHCFADRRPLLSQITDSVFVGVHLPNVGVKMVCPGETLYLDNAVAHGATRFTTTCNCVIYNGNKMVGRSTLKSCNNQPAKIDVLIPVHMTTLSDLLPFSDDGNDKTVFGQAMQIYDPSFQPVQPEYEDTTETPFRYSTVIWNSLQSLVMAYLYFRLKNLAGAVLVANSMNIPMVRAAVTNRCELPNDVYIYLWVLIILCVMSLASKLFSRLFSICRDLYNEQVRVEAQRIMNQ